MQSVCTKWALISTYSTLYTAARLCILFSFFERALDFASWLLFFAYFDLPAGARKSNTQPPNGEATSLIRTTAIGGEGLTVKPVARRSPNRWRWDVWLSRRRWPVAQRCCSTSVQLKTASTHSETWRPWSTSRRAEQSSSPCVLQLVLLEWASISTPWLLPTYK